MKKTEQEKFLTKWLKKENMYASSQEWNDIEVMDFATAWAEQVNKNLVKPDVRRCFSSVNLVTI